MQQWSYRTEMLTFAGKVNASGFQKEAAKFNAALNAAGSSAPAGHQESTPWDLETVAREVGGCEVGRGSAHRGELLG